MTKPLKGRPVLRDLRVPAYKAMPSGVTKMNDNTNLFGVNPAIRRAAKTFDYSTLARYPSVLSDGLKSAIAKKLRVSDAQVLVGGGSDDVIDIIAKAFLEQGDIVAVPSPSYEFYGMFAALAGAKVVRCPLREPGFALDAESVVSVKPRLAFLCSPNNPTGNTFSKKAIVEVLERTTAVVVLDGAYIEFADAPSLIRLVSKYDNLLVLRTFSKAYGLAGLRIGYCVGSERLVEEMSPARRPFALNSFSEAVAIEALKDDSFVRDVTETNRKERTWLFKRFAELGIAAYPSEANFILFKSPIPASELLDLMLDEGIALRDCSKQPTLKDCARVTVGSRKDNERFIGALASMAEVKR